MPKENQPKSVGIVVATHGNLAGALIEAVEFVLGRKSGLLGAGLEAGFDPPRYSRTLQSLVRRANTGAGVVVLVDLFGGTPGTVALSLTEANRVEVITGVNLPMAITAASLPEGLPLAQVCERILAAGSESIRSAGALLHSG